VGLRHIEGDLSLVGLNEILDNRDLALANSDFERAFGGPFGFSSSNLIEKRRGVKSSCVIPNS
jgi:hypothetical protein